MNTHIRLAQPGDESEIVAMIAERPAFELAPEQCTVTERRITAALFGPNPHVFCHIAEVDGEPVGLAVWFRNFSTGEGVSGIFLEDIFVRERFRRRGLGRAMLATLARECVDRGYSRLSWAVVDSNSPAIALYDAVGGRQMSDWISYRISGAELSALAGK